MSDYPVPGDEREQTRIVARAMADVRLAAWQGAFVLMIFTLCGCAAALHHIEALRRAKEASGG